MKIVAGRFKGRPLKAPKTDQTRPSSAQLRAAVFNICQNEIENSSFLDLFAGSGAMAFEALSRGAKKATLVEKDKEALKAITANCKALDVAVTVYPYDAKRALVGFKDERFSIIFLDPPYKTPVEPFIEACALLLETGGHLFVEDKVKTEIPESSLHLKSCRRFGSSRLRHYIKT